MRTILAIAALAATPLLGCGASPKQPGGPLEHQFDRQYIARIPTAEKRPILDAEGEVSVAQADLAKIDEDLEAARLEQHLAKNRLRQASLEVDAASAQVQNSRGNYDTQKIEAAASHRRSADRRRDAARAGIDYANARIRYLEALRSHALAALRAAQAKLELEETRLALANGIEPPGANLDVFDRQLAERMAEAAQLLTAATAKERDASAKKQRWQQLATAAGTAKR